MYYRSLMNGVAKNGVAKNGVAKNGVAKNGVAMNWVCVMNYLCGLWISLFCIKYFLTI
jgi:hypothetical protein